ncbi:peptidoglycan-binding protein [Hyalangium sp.]|uniref:peptidoglycan-binding protein n=1 Tax=Hyalangium sp. TaxID=2028555 RepID=UPI002D625263|nr:peptidoglycan-binding protein [Hyalangium sp.]HYI00977.1 peptidoglycan-binding protein [Hyalangium sp.]
MAPAWRVAKSLDQLLAELNSIAPKRSKASDGSIGDAAHAASDSDHNPWVKDGSMGVVTARDLTHDPANGASMHDIVAQLVKRRDPRIKYIIWDRQMWRSYAKSATRTKPALPAWTPAAYTGANGHTHHAHISVKTDKALYDSAASWGLSKTAVTSDTGGTSTTGGTSHTVSTKTPKFETYRTGVALSSRTLKEGSAGDDVKSVQAKVGVRADGYFGPVTKQTVIEWQKAHKLDPDGIVGPLTWKALTAPSGSPKKDTPSQDTPLVGTTEFIKAGRTFPSRDGYPLYAQGYDSTTGKNETWGSIVIASASGKNVSQIGCAMTAVTMALSGITGKAITPDEMAAFMKKNKGFGTGGDIQSWDLMGKLVTPEVDLVRLLDVKADKIDQELDAGRPVIVHVDYSTKVNGTREGKYDGTGDHWFLVTGRTQAKVYQANDPAGGKLITLHRMPDGRLEADTVTKYGTKYRTVGNAVTFSRGPAVRVADNKNQASTHTSTTTVTLVPTQTTQIVTANTNQTKSPLPAFQGGDRTATVKAIREECVRQGVTLPEQIAYVLATVQLETGDTFQPVKEAYYLGAKAEAYRKNNLRYYPYYGRGYVQLTWKENYAKYGKLLGLELVTSPDLTLRPDVSLYVLVHGMKTGSFTGKKLSDYITASSVDFRKARAIINGTNKAELIAGYARKWLSSLKLKNVA